MSGLSTYDVALLVVGVGAGFAAGIVHFVSLHRSVDALVCGSSGWAALLHIGRFAASGAVLLGLALLGAGPLLAGFFGVVAARRMVLRRYGGTV